MREETATNEPTMSFHIFGNADYKLERRERAWEVKVTKITTKTSTFLTLYFYNVSNYEPTTWLASIYSKG